MKKSVCLLALCMAVPFWGVLAEEAAGVKSAEVLSQKELRELLKDEKNTVAPAGELICGMSDADRAKLSELLKSDRPAARSFILEKLEVEKQLKQETAKEIQQLARQFRQSKDQAEKAQLRTRLRNLLGEQFQRTSTEISVRLKMQEERLAALRQAYQTRLQDSERLIDEQLEKIVSAQKKGANKKGGKSGKDDKTRKE